MVARGVAHRRLARVRLMSADTADKLPITQALSDRHTLRLNGKRTKDSVRTKNSRRIILVAYVAADVA